MRKKVSWGDLEENLSHLEHALKFLPNEEDETPISTKKEFLVQKYLVV